MSQDSDDIDLQKVMPAIENYGIKTKGKEVLTSAVKAKMQLMAKRTNALKKA